MMNEIILKYLKIFFYLVVLSTAIKANQETPNNDQQKDPDDSFFLFIDLTEFYTLPNSKNKLLSKIQVKDSSTLSNYSDGYNWASTIDCLNKKIYVLKASHGKQMLDEINYKNNNEFERINQTPNIFENARSIAFDWTTEYIYWVEFNNGQHSIKAIDTFFNNLKYIVNNFNDDLYIRKIHVYPKQKGLFFSDDYHIWYCSTSSNSSPNYFFNSQDNQRIQDFSIDYENDKLCWISYDEYVEDKISKLNCVNIGSSQWPVNDNDIDVVYETKGYAIHLAVFNNTFYWIASNGNTRTLYFKNGKEELAVKLVDNLGIQHRQLLYVPSTCPSDSNSYLSKTRIAKLDNINNQNSKHKNVTNFLLYANLIDFYTLPYPGNDKNISKIEIKDSSNLFDNKYKYTETFTTDCENNNIYILKTAGIDDNKTMLDVINYNDNNEFKRINQVPNIFDNATSIASDWTTGNIYFIDYINEKYSIKVTDKLFQQTKYIIDSTQGINISLIHIYPKQDELFFLHYNALYYYSNYSTSFNNLPQRLFDEIKNEEYLDFAIDYALDKLCWIVCVEEKYNLNCASINNSNRPLNSKDIDLIDEIKNPVWNLAVFNDTYYWIEFDDKNDVVQLYVKNGREKAVIVADHLKKQQNQLLFVYSNCPYIPSLSKKNLIENINDKNSEKQQENYGSYLLYVNSTGLYNLPYSTEKKQLSIVGIENSTEDNTYTSFRTFTTDYADKNIYILKPSPVIAGQVLDVINYNDNKFKRINQVPNIFDNATSIGFDWTTKNLYWIEFENSKYALKVSDESFTKIDYITNPSDMYMKNIEVYPKQKEIYFTDGHNLWYTSCLPGSSKNLLFYVSMKSELIVDFAIDYALDKLCWIGVEIKIQNNIPLFTLPYYLNCINIGNSNRPLNLQNIQRIYEFKSDRPIHLAVFNNAFYWTEYEFKEQVMYFINGNKTAVKITDGLTKSLNQFVFLMPNCPFYN